MLVSLQIRSRQSSLDFSSEDLPSADLSAVTAEVLLGALRMMETVKFYSATLTMDQVAAILDMLSEGSQGRMGKLGIFSPNVEDEAKVLLLEAVEERRLTSCIFTCKFRGFLYPHS